MNERDVTWTCNGISEGPRFLSYIVHVEDEETGEESDVIVHHTDDGLLEVEGTDAAALWVERDYRMQQVIAARACDDYWDARQVARHRSAS